MNTTAVRSDPDICSFGRVNADVGVKSGHCLRLSYGVVVRVVDVEANQSGCTLNRDDGARCMT